MATMQRASLRRPWSLALAGCCVLVLATALPGCGSRLTDLELATNSFVTPGGPDAGGTGSGGSGGIRGEIGPCNDDRLGELETSIDCGGPACPACGIGLSCSVDSDCASGSCEEQCLPLSCSNGQRDGDEVQTDCGGSCVLCAIGSSCDGASDCDSGVCEDGTCLQPTCSDGVLNGGEVNPDCGGEACAPCFTSTCMDGALNRDEVNVDCGGSCPACGAGASCTAARDCESGVCESVEEDRDICQAPTCSDQVHNGDETDMDCGGACAPCTVGMLCAVGDDCVDRVCRRAASTDPLRCVAASCDDQVSNANETGIDCGGNDCPACGVQQACDGAADCSSGRCLASRCAPTGTSNPCVANTDCLSGQCEGQSCAPSPIGAACLVDQDCFSGYCDEGLCRALDLIVSSEGLGTASDQLVKIYFELTSGIQSVPWNEVAVLYFFSAEQEATLLANSQWHTVPVASIRYVGVGDKQWIYVWRSSADGAISTTAQSYHELRHDPWIDFDNTNDYSYREGLGPSAEIVVCRRVGARWGLAQGQPPGYAPDPCQYVDSCEGVRCIDAAVP